MRKPHARSRLKTLPADQQKALFAHLSTNTLEETEAWLATGALGGTAIDTQHSSLSEFFAWYPLASQLHAAASLSDTLKAELRELPGLNLDSEQLSKAGQAIFETLAIKNQDSELYTALRRLRQNDSALQLKAQHDTKKLQQKDQELKLALDKFEFDGAKAALAQLKELKSIAADRALSEPEKIAAVRLKLFGTPRTLEEKA